ncbi:MAG: Plug domain-containing protein [Gemmatimonadetes bacterium]|nr:Plug domain-containing protein [Gemmatimonadota bacterium]
MHPLIERRAKTRAVASRRRLPVFYRPSSVLAPHAAETWFMNLLPAFATAAASAHLGTSRHRGPCRWRAGRPIALAAALLSVSAAPHVRAQPGAPFSTPDDRLAAIPGGGRSAAREVYTRSDIEAAGLHRFSEIIQWVSGWSATVGGVSWGSSLDGLPSGALTGIPLPDPTLLVNGQRVAVDAHGVWMPELAPVLVQQIDSVVVTRHPGLAAGSISSRGTVHVHARSAPAGASGLTWYRNGAETGDPGPYQWTPRATPNVGRTGPDAGGILAYGARRWDAELGFRYIRQDVTDARLRRLHGEGQSEFVYTRGPALRTRLDALGGRHELLLSHVAQRGSAYYQDVGRLSHALLSSSYIGLSGVLGTPAGARATYRLSHSDVWSEHSEGPGIPNGRSLSHGSLEWRMPVAGWEGIAALAVDSWGLEAAVPPDAQHRHTQGSMSLAAERRSPGGAEQRIAASLVRVGGRVADRFAATSEWRIGEGRTLHVAGSSVRVLPGEAFAANSWILPHRPVTIIDARLLRSEAGLTQQVTPSTAIYAAGLLSMVLPSGRAGSPTAESDSSWTGLRGTRIGARLGLTLGGPALRARVLYQAHASLRPSDDLSRAAAVVPRHALVASLAYSLAPSFRLAATAQLRSATRWDPALSPIGESYQLDPISRLDLSVEKWLWRRRIRAQFVIRNTFDTMEIYHPAGGEFGLRYFLVASLGWPRGT